MCTHSAHRHMYVHTHTCTQNTHASTGQKIDGKQHRAHLAKSFMFHIYFYFYWKIFLGLRMKNILWLHTLDVRVPVCEEF